MERWSRDEETTIRFDVNARGKSTLILAVLNMPAGVGEQDMTPIAASNLLAGFGQSPAKPHVQL